MSNHKPIEQIRSTWTENTQVRYRMEEVMNDLVEKDLQVFDRNIRDGILRAMFGHMPDGKLHLSIATLDHQGKAGNRYPSWDEIADARYTLLPDEANMAMMLPAKEQYVAIHSTTFHLFEIEPAS